MTTPGMDFRLLGPVQVLADGQAVDVGPPQRRTVLAALAVDAGRPVMVDTLIDRVWGDLSPQRVRRALHAHVTRIRRMLELAGVAEPVPARLVRRSGGYLLDVDPDRVDLHRFRYLRDRARDLDRARDPGVDIEQVTLLREALRLWRGEPLAGLTGTWAVRSRQGWSQQHVDVVLAWAKAELAVDNAAAVLGPLTDLVAESPYLEPLVALLMRALYAAGRSAQALELFLATRTRLVAELGVEPGVDLRRAHQEVLRNDGDNAAPAPVPARRPAPVPAQLPRDVRGFCGRGAELAQLDAILPTAGRRATAVVIGALAGTPGVGKTALAVYWAHRVAARFPDGQLYVNLRGFDPNGSTVDPTEAVHGFLDALGVAPERIPAGLAARTALFRSLLADRRMLIVLDNARDAEQVRPLLPGASGCLVLVTSRNRLSGLVAADGAHPLTLELLPPAEAREMLARRVGADRVAAEPQAVEEIIIRCARLPLALSIVAARAATHPHFPLGTLAVELRDTHSRWGALSGDDPATDVRAVFSWSYRSLTADAARLFRLLGLHAGPDFSVPVSASLAGIPVGHVRSLLAELTRAHLISEHIPGRFHFHDLLRAYAASQADEDEPDERRRAATRRTLDHYVHTAYAADRLLDPSRDPITLDPPLPGVVPERLAGQGQAMHWLAAEHAVLLAAVDRAARGGFHTHTWQLASILQDYLDRRGYWRDWSETQHQALAAARHLADRDGQAKAHLGIGRAATLLGRRDDAGTHLRRALRLSVEIGDATGEAAAHRHLAQLLHDHSRYAEALWHAEQALDLYRAAGHRAGQAGALNSVGWYHARLGNYQEALAYCEQALTAHRVVGNRYGQAATWDSLGHAHHHLGHHLRATTCYRHALDLYREAANRYGEADTLYHLGDTHRDAGDPEAARGVWRQALTILDELDHPDARQVRTKLRSV